MAASYVSARFEKTANRLVIRYRDDGGVPPLPGPSYFPTTPDELREFLLIEHVSDVVGERLVRIATLSDLTAYDIATLNEFEVPSTAGVTPGYTLRITLPTPSDWLSEEYPAQPFDFPIVAVPSATRFVVSRPFPSFKANLQWEAVGSGISGSTGITRRTSGALSVFRDSRMNLPFNSTAELETFVAAAKASIDALAAESTTATLTSETYTSQAS
jgi:hypothetical protein